jgi:hypothetical protein
MAFRAPYKSISPRVALTLAVVVSSFGRSATSQSVPNAESTHREPVLVELFTSEGCSDCPPADALLARLDATQFIPGAQAIVLSEHVTYWNHLGWRDPFSFEQMDQRQQAYRSRFALDSVYTPQMVVDGTVQLVGNDATAVSRAVAHASLASKVSLTIESAQWTDRGAQFSVNGIPSNARLIAALAEDATRSEVAKGENAGRTLHHVAVVSVLKDFGSGVKNGTSLLLSAPNVSSAKGEENALRLIVFLTDRKTDRVLAVAEQTLKPH